MQVYINNKSLWGSLVNTLLSLLDELEKYTPRFCFHSKLPIAGNCRLCLIEIFTSPKPQASCAYPLVPLMSFFTDSSLVQKARESVTEFILLNHPLDCPVCDQGGECDLQEQNYHYGSDRGRFYFSKSSFIDSFWNNQLKILMRRCIVCTRCIRLSSYCSSSANIGTTNRGEFSEVSSYVEQKSLAIEMLGGSVDLCPVGRSFSTNLSSKKNKNLNDKDDKNKKKVDDKDKKKKKKTKVILVGRPYKLKEPGMGVHHPDGSFGRFFFFSLAAASIVIVPPLIEIYFGYRLPFFR